MLAPAPNAVDTFAELLELLDSDAVSERVEDLVARGVGLGDILTLHLLPAWEHVDGRERDGHVDRATSGAAASIARRALALAVRLCARERPPARAGSLAVVSPAGSADLFGAEVVAELAAAQGWAVDVLTGPGTAVELAAYARARRPVAVVVTAHDPAGLPGLAAAVDAAHDAGVPVLAWGAGFGAGERRAHRLGIDAWAGTVEVAGGLLDLWRSRPPAPRSATPLPDAYWELERLRPSIVAAATEHAVAADGQADAPATSRAGDSLFDRLGAAVALGEPAILVEHLERQRRGPSGPQGHDARLLGLVDAVAAALPLTSVVAREHVVAAREQLRRSLVSPRRPASIRQAPPAPPGPGAGATGHAGPGAGVVFTDLLLLAALSCQTPFAVLSVPGANGMWSTLSYGFEQRASLDDPRLFELVAAQAEPLEMADLSAHAELARTPFARPPHSLRWAYAVPLRDAGGSLLGVVAVFDRWLREAGRREQRAMQAVARQGVAHLVQVRKMPTTVPSATPTPPRGPAPLARPDPLAGIRRRSPLQEGQQLLRSHEVAVLFDVTERTVINWAAAGKLPSLRTIGGHLRFRSEDVLDLLAGRVSRGA